MASRQYLTPISANRLAFFAQHRDSWDESTGFGRSFIDAGGIYADRYVRICEVICRTREACFGNDYTCPMTLGDHTAVEAMCVREYSFVYAPAGPMRLPVTLGQLAHHGYICHVVAMHMAGKKAPPDIAYTVRCHLEPEWDDNERRIVAEVASRYLSVVAFGPQAPNAG